MTEREERALANIIRYNQLSREEEASSHLNAEKEVKKQAFYLTHSVTTNDKGLEVCEDCGEGEAGLYENICTNFLDI